MQHPRFGGVAGHWPSSSPVVSCSELLRSATKSGMPANWVLPRQKIRRESKLYRDDIRDIQVTPCRFATPVSHHDQDFTLQRAALKKAGCKRLYEEKVSGANASARN